MTATYDPRDHTACDTPWTCAQCQEPVCPRCDPSPAEYRLCAECEWFSDDDPEGTAA